MVIKMKNTCYNCKHFCFELCDPKDPAKHFHYWCEKWERFVPDMELAGQYDYRGGSFFDDLQTGDAGCFMFTPLESPLHEDDWFERNKAENLSNRLEDLNLQEP